MNRTTMKNRATLLGVAATLTLASQAFAVVKADNTNNLNTSASWVGGVVPGTGDLIELTSNFTATRTSALGGNLTVAGISQSSGAGFQFQVSNTTNSTLTIGASGITLGSTVLNANLILACNVTANAAQTWNLGSRNLQVNTLSFSDGGNLISVTGAGLLDLRPAGAVTYGSNVTIDSPVSINNALAAVTLGGANTNNALTVASGKVIGSTIGNFGVASSFGDGGTNTAIVLGGGTTGGIIEYSGTTASTNRTINRDNRPTSPSSGIINVTQAGQTLTVSGALGYSNAGTGTEMGSWTFGGAGNLTLSGVINDPTGANTQSSIIKLGAGTLTLSANNLFEAGTTVSEGTLLVRNTAGSGTGIGAVTVANGATLGGDGFIAGDTTVNGNLSPGTSPGLLTFNDATAGVSDLTLAGTASYEVTGAGVRGTAYDAVNVEGLLTYGGTLGVAFSNAIVSDATFDLFDFGSQSALFSSITLSGSHVAVLNSGNAFSAADGSGNTWSFDHSNGVLSVAVVPEPAAVGLLGLAGLALRRRRMS